MAQCFLYGALRHQPLLELVLGRSLDLGLIETALPDYAVRSVSGGIYPVIQQAAGQVAPGVLATDLTDADLARLDFYAGGLGCKATDVTLADGSQALAYLPSSDRAADGDSWSLDRWVERWSPLVMVAAEEAMSYFGSRSAEELAGLFHRILARATTRLIAREGSHDPLALRGTVDVIERRRAYSSFFALDEFTLSHQRFDGQMSDPIDRAVFVSTDAAIVLPYDPVRDRVLLVEQVRLGPLGRGDPALWQLEPVAGLIDPGETPEETAHREAQEEAGLTFHGLELVGRNYASPGAATDFFHLYVGLCDLPDDARRSGGVDSEGENIRTHILSFDALLERSETHVTANAPLNLLTYWLGFHRDRLRADCSGAAAG